MVSLENIQPGESVDEWHNLIPVNLTIKGDASSVRVKSRYLHEVIMPLKEYTSLKEVSVRSVGNPASLGVNIFAVASACSLGSHPDIQKYFNLAVVARQRPGDCARSVQCVHQQQWQDPTRQRFAADI